MANPADKYAHKTFSQLESQISQMYREAYKDISKKLADFTKKHKAKDKQMLRDLKKGKITPEQYAQWMTGQVFIGKQWTSAKASIDATIKNVMNEASSLTHNKSIDVFVDNANYTAYQIEQGFSSGVNFDLYDRKTVSRLILEDPELLPRRKDVDGNKLEAWNTKTIANCVSQAVIQGESIDELSKRIARDTSIGAGRSSLLYARTAMTGAQNAGRVERMKEAQGMGIKVRKQWMATLDSRTRDSHAMLDGEVVEVNGVFSNGLRYPGDPDGAPREVYNCRCTLTYVYPGYSDYSKMERAFYYEEGDPGYDPNNPHKQWGTATGVTYNDWLKLKGKQPKIKESAYSVAMAEVQALADEVKAKGADKVFSGIWKNDVTYADWEDKKGSIQAKKDYYDAQITKYLDKMNNDPHSPEYQMWSDIVDKLLDHNDELLEFEMHGAEYSKLLKDLKEAQAKAMKLAPAPVSPFGPDAYSQEARDRAIWSEKKAYVDSKLRDRTGQVWIDATQEERAAIYDYTSSYSKFNEPLRGFEYGSNAFLGIGNTDLDAGWRHNGNNLNAMTDIIDKCSYDESMWLQRGVGYKGMDKFFQCSPDLLEHGTEAQLQRELLGRTPTEYGFMSCGSAKGQGFSTHPIILNVYAPSGTRMMYVEPISAYGNGSGLNWDGKSAQYSFGQEFETILQQGTQFKVAKVERSDKIYIDLWVVNQDTQQRWTP